MTARLPNRRVNETFRFALQFVEPLDVIRRALLRDPRGVASSPLGVALDRIAP
jgi:hypothetical protein